MIDFTFKVCVLLIFGYNNIYIDCNEDISDVYETLDADSLNSDSFETFNISSIENFIDSEDMSKMENETMPIDNVNEIRNTEGMNMFSAENAEIKPFLKTAERHNQGAISEEMNQTISKRPKVNYTFSVSIQRKSSHYTSGALVGKQWVLTSAGDFFNVRESIKMFKARLGSVNCKRGGVVIPIKQVEVHPSYVYNKPAFDIALLKLGMPVEYDQFVTPIAISHTRGRIVSAKFLATYWPRLIIKGQLLPPSAKERVKQNSMRVSTQKLIPWGECRKLVNDNNVILKPSSQCLEPIVTHHSPCMPDPGAPVVAKDGLWGITSGWTAKQCPMAVSATVFTRLSSPRVYSWLQLLLADS